MLTTHVRILTALVLAVIGAGVLTSPVRARQDRPRPEGRRDTPQPEVRGVLTAVNAGKGTLSVAVGDGRQEPVEKSFTVTKTTEVALSVGLGRRGSFREGKLADLAPGALVVLQLSADQKGVESILADGPSVRGLLKSVDAGKNTLIVTLRPNRRDESDEEKTFTVGKNAEIAVDDGRGKSFSLKEAKLADLPAGAVVTLKLSADLKQVPIVLAEGPTIVGTVKTVDADKKQLTLTTRMARGDDAGEEQTYTVASGIDVLLDDGKGRRFSLRDGTLADLPAGAVATLKLSVDQKSVMNIRAEGPSIQGLLKSVDADKRTVTVILGGGRRGTPEEEKTFAVAPDVRVVIDGKEAKLADVKTQDDRPAVGLRLSLDQKAVQGITVGRGR